MGKVWTLENRFRKMLEVEKATAQIQGEMRLIPSVVAKAICEKTDFKLQNILEKEKKTRHEVTAFVQELAEHVGDPEGSYVHWGLTSSDVLDSGLGLLIKEAGEVLQKSFLRLEKILWKQSKQHAGSPCCGRTHGRTAEPLTFGFKLAGFLLELKRNKARVLRALKQAQVGKLSGAVGAYGTLPAELEKKVCDQLGLLPESLATQVVPRDRHAELISTLAVTAAGLERLAVEIRLLQKSETEEVFEGFSKGQTGSSIMPHKKNPIYSENITGLSRLIRSYLSPALENIVLWHERDISHSSVERVMFSSCFILCDFALNRMAEVMENLVIDTDHMLANLELAENKGELWSSLLLTGLVQKGLARKEAYQLIQSLSFTLKHGESFYSKLLENKTILKYFSADEIKEKFSLDRRTAEIEKQVKDILENLKEEK